MTRFTVVWHDLARNELAEIWLQAADRNAVSLAADEIDKSLAKDASLKGTEVSKVSRELTLPPLQVLFRVLEKDRLVQIFSVARF